MLTETHNFYESPRILLVEDNPGDAHLVQRLLARTSRGRLAVDHVDRLSDARARLRRGDIGAVILDLGLPDSVGLDTIVSLEQDRAGVPIVVLSGCADPETRRTAATLGVVDFVAKDALEGEHLARMLEVLLERRRLEVELMELRRQDQSEVRAPALGVAASELTARCHRLAAWIEGTRDQIHRLRTLLPGPLGAGATGEDVGASLDPSRCALLDELCWQAELSAQVGLAELEPIQRLAARLRQGLPGAGRRILLAPLGAALQRLGEQVGETLPSNVTLRVKLGGGSDLLVDELGLGLAVRQLISALVDLASHPPQAVELALHTRRAPKAVVLGLFCDARVLDSVRLGAIPELLALVPLSPASSRPANVMLRSLGGGSSGRQSACIELTIPVDDQVLAARPTDAGAPD